MNQRNHNPGRTIGTFLIVFGLVMMAILLDLLNLGHPREYMMWQTLLIFIGLLSLFSRNAVGGLIMIAIGVYFLLPEIDLVLPEMLDKVYWPAAFVILGLGFLVSGIVRRSRME